MTLWFYIVRTFEANTRCTKIKVTKPLEMIILVHVHEYVSLQIVEEQKKYLGFARTILRTVRVKINACIVCTYVTV